MFPIHDYPYTDYHEMDLRWIIKLAKETMGLHLKVTGDKLQLLNANDDVVSEVTVSYAIKALQDINGNDITAYLVSASTDTTHLILTKGDGTSASYTIPYAIKAKEDVNGNDLVTYVKSVAVDNDKLDITLGNGTVAQITVPFALKAQKDENGKEISTYVASISVANDKLVVTDGDGVTLAQLTIPYAEKALKDDLGNTIKSTYASELTTGTTTVILKAKDGTVLNTITVPYATTAGHAGTADLATHSTNSVENVQVSGDTVVFTTYGGQTFTVTSPYAVKALKDDLGNTIKSTYVASVVQDANGKLTFKDATGTAIVELTPIINKATYDSYNNLIADYIKALAVSSGSDYVTVTHGNGVVDSIKIHYSDVAWKDTNGNVIKNVYVKRLECVEDIQDGKYKLVAYNGDTPEAEIFRIVLTADEAAHDPNGKLLTSYVADVSVDSNDNTKINVNDGEGNSLNVITVSGSASGTAVTLTSGTLPSCSYANETITFNAGAFPTVDTVTNPTISVGFSD